MNFTDLPIPEVVMEGIRRCGFTACTPIQAMTLPLTLAGRDVAGQAQTGTGKTAAYLIATFTRLLQNRREEKPTHLIAPRSLIIAPTRELAVQIEQDAQKLGGHLGFRIVAVYGGIDYEKQRALLQAGSIDILIGTPGRLIDYFKQKVYLCSGVEVLIIDEADRLFDMGFIVDLRYLLRRLPPYGKRLSLLFSATLSYRAQELSYEYMNQPEVISTLMEVKTVAKVTQSFYHAEGDKKIRLLIGLLKRDLNEEEDGVFGSRAMVFVNTKRMGERLERWMHANDLACGYLSGDVPQAKRLRVLQRFQGGELPILIATDVAGRGLHIDGVTHVINYDLPENPEDYVHRIGRTARAGAKGDAISLVDEEGAYCMEAIEAFVGSKFSISWPEESLLVELSPPQRRSEESELAEGYGERRGGFRRTTGTTGSRTDNSRRRPPPPRGRRVEKREEPKESAAFPQESPAPAELPPVVEMAMLPPVSESTGVPPSGCAPEAERKRRRRRRGKKPTQLSTEGGNTPSESPESGEE